MSSSLHASSRCLPQTIADDNTNDIVRTVVTNVTIAIASVLKGKHATIDASVANANHIPDLLSKVAMTHTTVTATAKVAKDKAKNTNASVSAKCFAQ